MPDPADTQHPEGARKLREWENISAGRPRDAQHPDPVREALDIAQTSLGRIADYRHNFAPLEGTGPILDAVERYARNCLAESRRLALADPPLGRAEQPEVPTQIRAEQIEQGDRVWIEDEGEWYTVTRVVVREADVLLWLDAEDEPWDALPRDQIMWRLSRVEQRGGGEREIEHVAVSEIRSGDEVRMGGLGWHTLSFVHGTTLGEVCLEIASGQGSGAHRFKFKPTDRIERRPAKPSLEGGER